MRRLSIIRFAANRSISQAVTSTEAFSAHLLFSVKIRAFPSGLMISYAMPLNDRSRTYRARDRVPLILQAN